MDATTFLQAFDSTRPITHSDDIRPGEVRLSVIQVSSVTRVAIKETMIPKVRSFAELLGGHVCWNSDLVSVILPPVK